MKAALTILLLIVSNVFMTMAWYGHLRFRSAPLWEVIVISWLIAFLEYCFQVPANRIGSYEFSAAQLKIIQEVITLIVFGAFSVLYLKQQFQWNYLVAFALIVGAVFFVFMGNGNAQTDDACTPIAQPDSQVAVHVKPFKEVEHFENIGNSSGVDRGVIADSFLQTGSIADSAFHSASGKQSPYLVNLLIGWVVFKLDYGAGFLFLALLGLAAW